MGTWQQPHFDHHLAEYDMVHKASRPTDFPAGVQQAGPELHSGAVLTKKGSSPARLSLSTYDRPDVAAVVTWATVRLRKIFFLGHRRSGFMNKKLPCVFYQITPDTWTICFVIPR